MNDLELANYISEKVARQYTVAKEVAAEHPRYSLVTLRAMCSLICQRIIEAQGLAVPNSSDLGFSIREVCSRTNSSASSRDALEKLRSLGNKGAHPEKEDLDDLRLHEFATSALAHALTALKFAYTKINPRGSLPAEITIAPIESGMKALCYQAIAEEDTDAQYWVGKHFLDKSITLEQKAYNDIANSNFSAQIEISEARKKANFWFELAANKSHSAALYEHGRLLIDGISGNDYISMGVNKIFRAAKAGNADANAFVGHVFYHGLHEQPKDYVEARVHFELAAEEDHPSALTMLGVMYLRGEGGPANHKASFYYTKRSAEAGYAVGQYNLYVHLWNGDIVEKEQTEALVWLNRSVEQNQPEALAALARLIEEGAVPNRTLADAENLYALAMKSAYVDELFRAKAAFQYARLLSLQSSRLQSLTTAAYTLQSCYEKVECRGEVADACVQLSKSVIGQMKNLIRNHQGTAEEITTAEIVSTYYFDSAGAPIPKKSIGDYRLSQALRSKNDAKKQISPQLYAHRLMEEFSPTLHSQSNGANSLRLVGSSGKKVGRNDPCPCSSGRKFKLCCGQ